MTSLSIADAKLIATLRKELQLSQEMLEEIRRIIKTINDDKFREEQKTRINRIQKVKEETISLQADYLGYLTKTSRALMHREEWVRIGSRILSVIDKLSGISYRLGFLTEKNWLVPERVSANLVRICDNVSAMTELLNQAMIKLLNEPAQTLEDLRKIAELENSTDALYRETIFEVLEANISSSTMLLLLSIAEMLEDSSDTIYDMVSNLYIVLLEIT
ncbi:MAG: hypothetical protein LM590_02230 [Thermofilum sp.]|jgi:uncharacterized protein Yka (UPF0111/DUF47 family)|nr:hypothetical protein [Thermofilum sp.]